MTRTQQLKEDMLCAKHNQVRIAVKPEWDTADLPLSLPERKAQALCNILDNMPLYIGEGELIVGSRTVFGHRGEDKNKSDMNIFALPRCVNEEDIALFGRNDQMSACGHFTPNYGVILQGGIRGVLDRAYRSLAQMKDENKAAFLRAVIRAYGGFSRLILRYAEYAQRCAGAQSGNRQEELLHIAENCRAIAYDAPHTFDQAVQLVWFSHLSLLIESFQFVSYGRLDQLFAPYSHAKDHAWEQQIIDCLVVKMYDGGDVIDSYFGTYSGQHTLTLGGVTPEGEDAVNPVTYMFLDAIGRVGLPEPMVEIRYNSKNPEKFLQKAAESSIKGINTFAYYRDDLFIRNLIRHGLPERDANNYAFGLCQDVLIPGRLTPYVGMEVPMGYELLQTLREVPNDITFEELTDRYRKRLFERIDLRVASYNRWSEGIKRWNAGDHEGFLSQVRAGEIPLSWAGNSPMAPLPLASALFDGCLEEGIDLAVYPYALPYKGMVLASPVVGINSLMAVRKCAIEDKICTIRQIVDACDNNFEGEEPLRQALWNAPKWDNDDDYVDVPARELLAQCCRRISSHTTIYGTRFLAGIHQPHPVSDGWQLQATPEGRKAKEPVPVTLSPENGTLTAGPTAAMHTVAQLDDSVYQWNISLMLQYSSAIFAGEDGLENFCDMLKTYFAQGGAQFQPNIVNISDLRQAQIQPEKYKDLVVRLWGVSVQFINLPREIQDEFMARFSV